LQVAIPKAKRRRRKEVLSNTLRHAECRPRTVLNRRLEVTQEVIKYLLKVDPGQTKKMGVFMLEYNKPKLHIARLDLRDKEDYCTDRKRNGQTLILPSFVI
jgi:hypothetical protein